MVQHAQAAKQMLLKSTWKCLIRLPGIVLAFHEFSHSPFDVIFSLAVRLLRLGTSASLHAPGFVSCSHFVCFCSANNPKLGTSNDTLYICRFT